MDRKILVVDDEELIRTLLKDTFTAEGFTVYSVESGEEAMQLLTEQKIQVFFVDLKLPEMDGINLCKLIKAEKPTACIYAITGYKSLYDLLTCLEAGFDDYFPKPFDLALLTKKAHDAFEKLDRWRKM